MNSPNAHFFRILQPDPDEKGDALHQTITGLNQGQISSETTLAKLTDFAEIPYSPFAYWVDSEVVQLFTKFPSLDSGGIDAKQGLITADDFRFLKLLWEIPIESQLNLITLKIYNNQSFQDHCKYETSNGKRWVPFAKGGAYSPYSADLSLVVDWEFDGQRIKNFVNPETGRTFSRPQNTEYYFRPGLTWTLRTTSKLSMRVLPTGVIFSHKGPAIFTQGDDYTQLLTLLAITNSEPFARLVKLQLGAASAAARSYEVGIIQKIPIPLRHLNIDIELTDLSYRSKSLACSADFGDEVTHSFKIPSIFLHCNNYERIPVMLDAFATNETDRLTRLNAIQVEIDQKVAVLYGVPELLEMVDTESIQDDDPDLSEEGDQWEAIAATPQDLVEDLLLWCEGVAFGRWDVRFALDRSLLPELQGPFDPLPICPPGALVDPGGLPARLESIVSETWLCARPNVISLPEDLQGPATIPDCEYPLNIAWQGILVDDSTHPRDIVTAIRQVLQLIWGDKIAVIEAEACQILGFDTLRDWFRNPTKGFYNFHIKRYSKSRRKAPIYWLLQSSKRNYGIWLYYHCLTKDTYFLAGRDYVDPKIKLEESRLNDMRQAVAGKSGSALKIHEKAIAAQADLVEEIKAFGKALDEVALLELDPDLNDGVVLNIAPLRELTPWREARKYWNQLIEGKYTWSTISQQMLKKGHHKG